MNNDEYIETTLKPLRLSVRSGVMRGYSYQYGKAYALNQEEFDVESRAIRHCNLWLKDRTDKLIRAENGVCIQPPLAKEINNGIS